MNALNSIVHTSKIGQAFVDWRKSRRAFFEACIAVLHQRRSGQLMSFLHLDLKQRLYYLILFLLLRLMICGEILTNSTQAAYFPPSGKTDVRILVLGDSIAWGQGLRDRDKFVSRFSEMVSGCDGTVNVEAFVLAHSGAVIGDSNGGSFKIKPGEVPSSSPTIRVQNLMFADSPHTVDLVIVDGGINDVGVGTILNPFTTATDLKAGIEKYCFEKMSDLLTEISEKYTNATVIVTGYYQIVSNDSDLLLLELLLVNMGLRSGTWVGGVFVGVLTEVNKNEIIDNCKLFARESNAQLRNAIGTANFRLIAKGSAPRIFFADPRFHSDNAVFGSDNWLFGLDYWGNPEDSVAEQRQGQCDDAGLDPAPYFKCVRASAGHPNKDGSWAYANAVADAAFTHNSGLSWVRFGLPMFGSGSFQSPFTQLGDALEALPPGGTIRIMTSVTSEVVSITKPCIIEACGGPVIIGK